MRLGARGMRSRALSAAHGALVLVAAIALVTPLLSGTATASAAPAGLTASVIDYPTWAEVKAARNNEAKAKKQIAAVKAALAQLAADLQAAQAEEIARGEAYERAQDAYDEQVMVAEGLRTQADTARTEADTARKQASRLLAMLAKSGNGDVVANLLVNSADASDLLYRLEAMDRLSDQSNKVYEDALQLQNTAESLAAQADIAEKKRDELRELAEQALDAARTATKAVEKALADQVVHKAELEAQLSVLVEKREATEKDYRAGVAAREKARKEREAAERAAEAAAGGVNSQGWARPSAGYISSGYGYRYHPIYHTWRLHNGTDIAGQGCGAPIRAAHSGTVTYAGWNGTLGNYVQIAHGGGASTGYGHIRPGGINVGYGQWVNAGQVIAYVGTTGASTGCHLHFIVRVNGQLANPVPFMRNRGIWLG